MTRAKNALYFALGMAAAVCLTGRAQFEWRDVARLDSGAVWSIRLGTVAAVNVGGKPSITAVARHKLGEAETTYRVVVPVAHCGLPRGDVPDLTPESVE